METPAEEIPAMVLEALVCVSMEIYVIPSVLHVLKEINWLLPFTGKYMPNLNTDQAKAIAQENKRFITFWSAFTFNEIVSEQALAYCMMFVDKHNKIEAIARNKSFTYKGKARYNRKQRRRLRRENYIKAPNDRPIE